MEMLGLLQLFVLFVARASSVTQLLGSVGFMDAASYLGPHTHTNRGTCPSVGL